MASTEGTTSGKWTWERLGLRRSVLDTIRSGDGDELVVVVVVERELILGTHLVWAYIVV